MEDEKASILYPLTLLPRSRRVGRKHQEISGAVLLDLDDDFCHGSSSANDVSECSVSVRGVEQTVYLLTSHNFVDEPAGRPQLTSRQLQKHAANACFQPVDPLPVDLEAVNEVLKPT